MPVSVWYQLWPKTNSGNVSFKTAKWTKRGLQSCLLFFKWVSEPSGCSPAFLDVPFLSWIHQTTTVTPEPGNYSCGCLLGCESHELKPADGWVGVWGAQSWENGMWFKGREQRFGLDGDTGTRGAGEKVVIWCRECDICDVNSQDWQHVAEI